MAAIAKALIVILVTVLSAGGAWAQANEPGPAAERVFIVRLQQALRSDDKQWIADNCRYPVRVGLPGLAQIANRTALIRNYGRVFTPPLKTAVLAQDPDQAFRNWQGTMIGEGATNIWIRDDDKQRFGIVTVNTK